MRHDGMIMRPALFKGVAETDPIYRYSIGFASQFGEACHTLETKVLVRPHREV